MVSYILIGELMNKAVYMKPKYMIGAVLVLVIIILGVAAVRIFSGPEDTWLCKNGTWIKHGNPKDQAPESGCGVANSDNQEDGETAKSEGVPFEKSGYLIRNNPGLKPNVWYLSFEEKSSPAVLVELNFESSQAVSGFKVGDRVAVTGVKDNGVITVSGIKADVTKTSGDVATRSIKLYYYNEKNDKSDNAGNPSCEQSYVLPVERQLPVTETPIQDTIKLLLKGEITSLEKAAGFTTEFPNSQFLLKGADLKNGVLTLDFTEVPGFTDGGSCRINILQAQVEKTAKQFPEVKQVKYTNLLWQP